MKKALSHTLIYVTVAIAFFATPAQAQIFGQTKGGAYYTIALPETWNGGLVIWNHGYSFSPISPEPDLGPLAATQLAQGYAVAASSYRLTQWAVFDTADDIEELGRAFVKHVGKPSQVIVTGASLGGIVTADALERARIPVDGAYTFCGAMAGSRAWDGALDLRLTYDVICGDVAPIPGGATGLPGAPGFPGVIDPGAVAIASNICMGTLVPPALRTPDQQARLNKFVESTTLPENFIITDLVFGTNGLSDLIYDSQKLNGGQGVGNKQVRYKDPYINKNIERVKAVSKPERRLKGNFRPKGKLNNPDVKIVSIHTDKDGLVLVENESEYQRVIDEDNLSVGIVVEDVPSHCAFTPAELVSGWESLRGWLAGAPQPGAATMQGTCQALEAAGIPGITGPCRYDPAYEIGDFSDRVLPRNNKKKKKRKKRHHH